MTKVDILAVGAHPDDVELSCCGTLLRHISLGKTVGLMDLTMGELGTRGTQEIREKEANESAKKMGAIFRVNAKMADGFFNYSQENVIKIIETIRWCQPEIVLANSPSDRHPDHGRAAKLTADACYYAGLEKIATRDREGNSQTKWRPRAVYHYIQDRDLEPDFVVDISPFFEKKMELVLTFRSQFYLPEATEYEDELKTPISGKDFIEFLEAKAKAFGRRIGVELAEGFIADRTIGVDNFFNLL